MQTTAREEARHLPLCPRDTLCCAAAGAGTLTAAIDSGDTVAAASSSSSSIEVENWLQRVEQALQRPGGPGAERACELITELGGVSGTEVRGHRQALAPAFAALAGALESWQPLRALDAVAAAIRRHRTLRDTARRNVELGSALDTLLAGAAADPRSWTADGFVHMCRTQAQLRRPCDAFWARVAEAGVPADVPTPSVARAAGSAASLYSRARRAPPADLTASMARSIARAAPSAPPVGVAKLSRALARLHTVQPLQGAVPEPLLAAAARVAPHADAGSAAEVMFAFSQLQAPVEGALRQALLRAAAAGAGAMSPRALCKTLQACAAFDVRLLGVLADAFAHSTERALPAMRPHDVALTAWALARLGVDLSDESGLEGALVAALRRSAAAMAAGEVAVAWWASSVLSARLAACMRDAHAGGAVDAAAALRAAVAKGVPIEGTLRDDLLAAAREGLPDAPPARVASVVWALSTIGELCSAWEEPRWQLAAAVTRALPELRPHEVASILRALATAKVVAAPALQAALADAVRRAARHMQPAPLVDALWALSQLRLPLSAAAHESLVAGLSRRAPLLTSRAAASGVLAAAALGLRGGASLRKHTGVLIATASTIISPAGLASMLRALVAIGCLPAQSAYVEREIGAAVVRAAPHTSTVEVVALLVALREADLKRGKGGPGKALRGIVTSADAELSARDTVRALSALAALRTPPTQRWVWNALKRASQSQDLAACDAAGALGAMADASLTDENLFAALLERAVADGGGLTHREILPLLRALAGPHQVPFGVWGRVQALLVRDGRQVGTRDMLEVVRLLRVCGKEPTGEVGHVVAHVLQRSRERLSAEEAEEAGRALRATGVVSAVPSELATA